MTYSQQTPTSSQTVESRSVSLYTLHKLSDLPVLIQAETAKFSSVYTPRGTAFYHNFRVVTTMTTEVWRKLEVIGKMVVDL